MTQERDSEEFMYFVIDRIVPFPVILENAGLEGYSYGEVYCPFHDNTDTPAAKLYNDEEGDSLFCYSERQMYSPSDVIKEGIIDSRLQNVFYNIWRQLGEKQKEYLKEEYGIQAVFNKGFQDKMKELDKFKTGDITYDEFCEIALEAVECL